jgi:hypothetical protein
LKGSSGLDIKVEKDIVFYNFIYDGEIEIDWYSLLICNIYFNDDYDTGINNDTNCNDQWCY